MPPFFLAVIPQTTPCGNMMFLLLRGGGKGGGVRCMWGGKGRERKSGFQAKENLLMCIYSLYNTIRYFYTSKNRAASERKLLLQKFE